MYLNFLFLISFLAFNLNKDLKCTTIVFLIIYYYKIIILTSINPNADQPDPNPKWIVFIAITDSL